MMIYLTQALSFLLHIDRSLLAIHATYGGFLYAVLFIIVFCETGLVIAPFLPGDSLLFAAGALAGLGALNIWALIIGVTLAAILGDSLNYAIGHRLGAHVQTTKNLFGIPINPAHLKKAEVFFKHHGHRAIVLARFAPIIRTFVPFFAGASNMPKATFLRYNIIGGILWVCLFTLSGYFFGNLPIVKERFSLIIIAIVIISLIPIIKEYFSQNRDTT